MLISIALTLTNLVFALIVTDYISSTPLANVNLETLNAKFIQMGCAPNAEIITSLLRVIA